MHQFRRRNVTKVTALHPPFSLGLAQRKRAVHGPKEKRFWPLYTKADGRFLRRCGGDLPAFCWVRCPFCVNRYCSVANHGVAVFVGAEPKGPSVYSRALRAYPGDWRQPVNRRSSAARRPAPSTAAVARSEAERAGAKRRGLSILRPVTHPMLTFAAADFQSLFNV